MVRGCTLTFVIWLVGLNGGCSSNDSTHQCLGGEWFDGSCLLQHCPDRQCPDGYVCYHDQCTETICLGVACSPGQVCRSGDCKTIVCGDGTIDVGEVCDDGVGNSNSWTVTPHCNSSCTGLGPSCGDGIQNGPEQGVDCGEDCVPCVLPPIPNPMIFAYGAFSGGFEPALLNQETNLVVPNVVEIFDVQESLIRTLSEKGVLCAKHTPLLPAKNSDNADWYDPNGLDCENPQGANIQACIDRNVQLWEQGYASEIGIAGGFMALAIDEFDIALHAEDPQAQYVAYLGRETLKRVKENHQDRLIFAWGAGVNPSAETLTYLKNFADRFLLEIYCPETADIGACKSTINSRVQALKTFCQGLSCDGIMQKTVIGLATANTENWAYDRSPEIDFPHYLDSEINFIKTTTVLKDLPGLAFYSYARTRPETIAWINKLARHYYLKGQTSMFGNGVVDLSIVKDPSFEGEIGWTLSPGSGGSTVVKTNTDVGINPVRPGLLPRVPHGSSVLFMMRGTTQNQASQSVTVAGNSFYHVDVYAKNKTSPTEAAKGDVLIQDASFNNLVTYQNVSTVKSNLKEVYDPAQHLWTRFRMEFKTPPGVTLVNILLSDLAASTAEVTLWDFMELENLKAGSLTAGILGSSPSTELLMNGGFEQDTLYWTEWLAYGNTLHGGIVSNPVQEGTKSIMAETGEKVQTELPVTVWYQAVFLQNPHSYKLSGCIYIEQIDPGAAAYLYVRLTKSDDGSTLDIPVRANPSILGEWQCISTEFMLEWQYKNTALLSSRIQGPHTRVYFDNIHIEKVL